MLANGISRSILKYDRPQLTMQFTWVVWYDLVTFTGSWDTKGIKRGGYTNVEHIHNTSLPGKVSIPISQIS